MLSDLDETIRQILVKGWESKGESSAVEVSFEIPDRQWSTGISKPTLNCYLFDIRENRELRQHGIENVAKGGRIDHRQRPVAYFDLTYLITAWTREVEDEHRLLWYTLQTMMHFERIPDPYLQGALRGREMPIYARTAMPEGVLKSPGEFWTALENQIKPSISCVITLSLNRDEIAVSPPVLKSEIRPFQMHPVTADQLRPAQIYVPYKDTQLRPAQDKTSDESALQGEWGWFGGFVRSQGQPVAGAEVWIKEHGIKTQTDAEGRYRLRVPSPGTYTLIVRQGGGIKDREREITFSPQSGCDFSL